MMRKQKKLYKNIISFILSIMILASNINLSFAGSTTIYIDSTNDFIEFSEKASLDTYFKGKTVILRSDIDLSGIDSVSVPTFAGVFDGQGNTISGISISQNGSVKGLFRYLQEEGVIRDLNISGNVTPSGSQNVVGGLVGNNKGTIENCNFVGDVEGDNNIGGLVGINEVTGTITNCSSEGSVMGNHFTGGIVGQNLGTIFKSTNHSEVNISISEPTRNIKDINWSQINSTENIKAHTDTGGIAGFSTGFIQDSVNRGPIGYKDMGYNVGGIVGRQSGYLSNCQNYNTISGRKDVGGIVGQIEPYLMLVFSEDNLQKLDKELNVLQNLLNNSFNSAQTSSLSVYSKLDSILESFDNTMDNVQILSKGTVDYVDDIADTINITSKRIEYTLEEIIPILDDAEKSSIYLSNGLDYIESGFNNLEITSDKMADALYESKYSINNLRDTIKFTDNAIYSLRISLQSLSRNLNNKENINAILEEIEKSLKELEELFEGNNIENIIKSLKEIISNNDWNWDENQREKIELILEELKAIPEIINTISSIVSDLNTEISSIISSGLSNTGDNIRKDLTSIFNNLAKASMSLDGSLQGINHTISKLESTSKQSSKAFNDFSHGFDKFENSCKTMTRIIVSIRDLLDSLTSEPTIELPNIGSTYRQAGDDLFNNLGDISSKINKMSKEIKDSKGELINDVQAISNQVLKILNLLITSREDVGISEHIEDNSEEDPNTLRAGTVYKNQNYGSIHGSVNVGGIVGSMAIEYDLDPEDDILKKGTPSLNFKYFTTAILRECINHGKVTAKKDYTGGIVGLMNLGIITKSENYGDVESIEGDYVGGIAGASYATIDKSFVRSSLSGKNYMGGIAGYGKNLSNSYSLVQLQNGVEYIGSIAGDVEGDISNNYYVHDTIAAVDGISYTNKASPLSYDELLKVEDLPTAFSEFYLTFIADGNIVEKIPFNYGDSFDLNLLPHIPFKDRHESSWEDFNHENMTFNTIVEAIYTPFSSVLSSNIVRENDTLPLLLAEGQFSKDINLKIQPCDINDDEFTMNDSKVLEAWNIELVGLENEDETVTLRLLMPETKRKISVWQLGDTGWEKLESSINGSYIVFEMNGTSGIFSIVENQFPWIMSIILVSIFLALILIFFIHKSKSNY